MRFAEACSGCPILQDIKLSDILSKRQDHVYIELVSVERVHLGENWNRGQCLAIVVNELVECAFPRCINIVKVGRVST